MSGSPALRDVVLPVVTIDPGADGVWLQRFLRSAFLIGSRGYALTAAHVIPAEGDGLAVLTADDAGWRAHLVDGWEAHPTEDVAVLKVAGPLTPSWMSLAGSWEGQSLPYRSWGYPASVMYEIVDNGLARPRPDLVYTQGYIRRRVSSPLPGLVGSQFFELRRASRLRLLGWTGTTNGHWDQVARGGRLRRAARDRGRQPTPDMAGHSGFAQATWKNRGAYSSATLMMSSSMTTGNVSTGM